MNYAARVRAALAVGGDLTQFAAYRDDPVSLAIEVLNVSPWSRQAEVLRAVAAHIRIAVRSGHKTGKSELLALAAFWFCLTRSGARVVLTAPTYRQVRQVLWKAIKRLALRLPAGVVLQVNDVPEYGVQFANGSEIIGFTADNAEKFAGISGADLMFIVDEASGVEAEIFEAIEGSAAGGAIVIMAGNPTMTSGVFYHAFHEGREQWVLFHISSEESPNVVEGRVVIPGLATRAWIEKRKKDWGEESPLYAVRVRGDFPSQGENAVIGIIHVERSTTRYEELVAPHMPREREMREELFSKLGRLQIGADIARYGDDETVLMPRRGQVVLPPVCLRGLDGPGVAERIVQVAISLRRSYMKRGASHQLSSTMSTEYLAHERVLVCVDVIGIGASAFDHLRHHYKDEVEAVDVDVSRSATDETYFRLRDQLWFGVRDWLIAGGCLPSDPTLEAELLAPTYHVEPNGQLKVSSKDEIKKRIGRSPDRADALALAIYSPASRPSMRRTPAGNLWTR